LTGHAAGRAVAFARRPFGILAVWLQIQASGIPPSTPLTDTSMSISASGLPMITRCAPVRIVAAVEPSVAFWRDRFGFSVENEVPGADGALIFASVTNGAVELMYQTRASVLADTPMEHRAKREQELSGDSTALFFHVADLDAVERAIAGAPVEKARHDTFYGTTEIYVREPGGMVVGFSAPARTGEATS
jgi:uncharacterized glyoxalase superfamily protein PhnB